MAYVGALFDPRTNIIHMLGCDTIDKEDTNICFEVNLCDLVDFMSDIDLKKVKLVLDHWSKILHDTYDVWHHDLDLIVLKYLTFV